MHNIRVGVLMGGRSIEREVSFNSGRTVCDHLDTACYSIIPLFQTQAGTLYILPWKFLHRGKIADFEHRLSSEAQSLSWDALKEMIDFMYIATHGTYAEDGRLQGFLELLGIPYLGSGVFASALGMNKTIQKSFLRHAGIDVPRSITVQPTDIINIINIEHYRAVLLEELKAQQLTFPLIVKPEHEGSSLGVSVVYNLEELPAALLAACSINSAYQQPVLIEERLVGMEFSCITLVDKAQKRFIPLQPTEIVPEKDRHLFDYEQKYMPGRAAQYTPARCSPEIIERIQTVCVRTTEALGMKIMSRIDGFVTCDGRVVIIDPNSLSGMAPTSFLFKQAAMHNMNHTQLINYLIATELSQPSSLKDLLHTTSKQESEPMQEIKKIRVGVLMGGNSNEREISLESGRNITYKLSPHRYEVTPLFANDAMELFVLDQTLLVRNSTHEISELVTKERQVLWNDLPKLFDFIFIGLHGGSGENGCVQGALEMLDMPYNGSSVLTSSLCMDKHKTNAFLKDAGFDVPAYFFVSRQEWQQNQDTVLTQITDSLSFPIIVKPHDDGCSVLVQKIDTVQALTKAIDQVLTSKGKSGALVEEYIQAMELTVGVLGNDNPQALPPSQAIANQGVLSIEEKFLPGAGENQTPAPLSPAALVFVQRTIEAVYKTVGCSGYARIDCFYQKAEESPTGSERVIILEINTLPGLTPATCIFHQAAELGIKPMDFIDCIVQLGFEKHGRRLLQTKEAHSQQSELKKGLEKVNPFLTTVTKEQDDL